MNIMTILNKLKEANLVPDTEEGISLFSDCFNKFGISLLLLKDESTFNRIVTLLKENNIPLQKANSIYALRIFAVDVNELESIITEFFAMNEMNFLRTYPELLAEPRNIHFIAENMKTYQSNGTVYKNRSGYDLNVLLSTTTEAKDYNDINSYLKKYLQDASLIDKLENLEANGGEEDVNVALELQKVENKICEEYLVPVEDGWKVVINDKEVNSFREVKNTINTITKLNLPITFHDALIVVLFYRTYLTTQEIDDIIQNVLFKEVK